jgi:spore maturation protein CgeB
MSCKTRRDRIKERFQRRRTSIDRQLEIDPEGKRHTDQSTRLQAQFGGKSDRVHRSAGNPSHRLEEHYGAQRALALYCSVNTARYRPLEVPTRWDLTYLGTYSPDRQPTLDRLMIEPARRRPHLRFAVAGPQYPKDIAWPANVERIEHLPPTEHAAFYCALRFALKVTRADMIAADFSPSVRLFEAGACGTPIISDRWDGIETLFRPGSEIILAEDAADVIAALGLSTSAIGSAARDVVLAEHSAAARAEQFEADLLRARHDDRDSAAGKRELA